MHKMRLKGLPLGRAIQDVRLDPLVLAVLRHVRHVRLDQILQDLLVGLDAGSQGRRSA